MLLWLALFLWQHLCAQNLFNSWQFSLLACFQLILFFFHWELSPFLLNLFSTDNVTLTSSLSMTASLCAKSHQFWTLQPFKPVDKPARTWRAYPTNFFYARAFCGRKNDRWWLVGLRIHSFFSPRIWIRSKLLEATDLDPDSTFACSKT